MTSHSNDPSTRNDRKQQTFTRRSFLKKTATTVLSALALPPAALAYARYAEPGWLETRSVALTFSRLPAGLNGIKVVQFSDTHLGYHFDAEGLSALAKTVTALKPDLIAFTGDLVDWGVGAQGPAYAEALRQFEAPLGKFAVLGNHDHYRRADEVVRTLEAGGFRTLLNDAVQVRRGNAGLWVAGVEDMWQGKPDLGKAVAPVKDDDFVLLLSHCPDFADIAAERQTIDLQLSGHSHGGQVRLPFYGHVITPRFAQNYVIGHYRIGTSLQLYVNRGIGVSQHPVRFLCRPELTVLTLKQE